MSDSELIVGIDIGGTFTDVCAIFPDGRLWSTKVSSTPPQFEQGFLNGIKELANELDTSVAELLSRVARIGHGTTVATNALLTREGATVGLLATAGHSEATLLMRGEGRTAGQTADQMIRVHTSDKPEPFVPKSRIREVPERIDRNGNIVAPLNEDAAREAIKELADEGTEAYAVSLLWSVRNPEHEQRVADLIKEVVGAETHVTISSEVSDRVGEYERSVGAIMNAFVADRTNDYLTSVETGVRDEGFEGPLMIMQCSGGVATVDRVVERPISTLQSGPVGGVIGSTYLGDRTDRRNLITTDMGGTSFDVAMIIDGVPERAPGTVLDRYSFYLPTVDVRSIGAGGGSIARYDASSHSLRVGPKSAGAVPGPACYGRGGAEPTVTDASLVLGYIDADYFLGGRVKLDLEAAKNAVAKVAEPLGLTIDEAAAGIVQIIEHQMADLIRGLTVERGYDPRDFDLLVFGGAGPQHAGNCAKELGTRSAIVPLGVVASAWSALGVAAADLTVTVESGQRLVPPFDVNQIVGIMDGLEEEVRKRLETETVKSETVVEFEADVQYQGQIHQLSLSIDKDDLLQTEDFSTDISDRFTEEYGRLYGEAATLPGTPVEIVVLRAHGKRTTPKPGFVAADATAADSVEEHSREVYWPSERRRTATRVVRVPSAVPPGMKLEGPVIVEMPLTTLVVHPGQLAESDDVGNIVVTTA